MVIVTVCPTVRPIRLSVDVPSTISLPVRGGRPASKVGDSNGPRPAATAIAGTTKPPIPIVP